MNQQQLAQLLLTHSLPTRRRYKITKPEIQTNQIQQFLHTYVNDEDLFIFGCYVQPGYQVKCINTKNREKSCLKIKNKPQTLQLLSQNQLIITTIDPNQQHKLHITQWNLSNHKSTSMVHQLTLGYFTVMLFSEMGMVGVVEQSKRNEDDIGTVVKISYYQVRDSRIQFVYTRSFMFEAFDGDIIAKKLNKHSKIGLFYQSYLSQDIIKFITICMDQSNSPIIKSHFISQQISPVSTKYLKSYIRDSCQVEQGKFYFQIETLVDLEELCHSVQELCGDPRHIIHEQNYQKYRRQMGLLAQQYERYQACQSIYWLQYQGYKQVFVDSSRHHIQFTNNIRPIQQRYRTLRSVTDRIQNFDIKSQQYNLSQIQQHDKDTGTILIYYVSPVDLSIRAVQKLTQSPAHRMTWSECSNSKMLCIERIVYEFFGRAQKVEYEVRILSTPFQFQANLVAAFFMDSVVLGCDEGLLASVAQLLQE